MPRTIPDKCRLLHAPYRQPRLHVGDRADCHLRGTVVVTSWTDARISWPRCLPLQSKGHPSLLLDDELARAVRTESAAAVCLWWGASPNVVRQWRRFLDVDRVNNPGTHRLVQANPEAGAAAIKEKEWTEDERQAKKETAHRLDLGRYLQPGWHGPRWTAAKKRLLGKLPDAEVARQIGRTTNAVRIKREKLGLPNPESRAWTAEELVHLGTAIDGRVADRIDRTASAVAQKRIALGIPAARRTSRKRSGGAAS